MKLLSLCDPTQYRHPPLDVPSFYQQLAKDPRVTFYHVPSPWAIADPTHCLENRLPNVKAILVSGANTRHLSYENFVALGEETAQDIHLEAIDLVFCRTLKPFHPDYLKRLTGWERFTRFVNSPMSKQAQIQSAFVLNIAQDYMPEAIATHQVSKALAFFEQFQTVVAKQPNSTGGRGVFKIRYANGKYHVDNVLTGEGTFATFRQVMAYLQAGTAEPIQFCRYLANTTAGDKRVVVVDGEIYGSYVRRSKSGHWVNNVSADGECTLAEMTAAETEAIANTVGHYQAMGLHTLGYDFLMDDDGSWRISEINAGNIGGFARLELLTGKPVMTRFIDWLIDFSHRPHVVPAAAPTVRRELVV
ncbi:MAG: YheC/YheD family protein [Cyanobacteria bacterium P01_A01_bin.116]